jgi:hypothetical protein
MDDLGHASTKMAGEGEDEVSHLLRAPEYVERSLSEMLPTGWSRALLVNEQCQCESVVYLDHLSGSVHRELPYEYRTTLLSIAERESGLSSAFGGDASKANTHSSLLHATNALIYPHVQRDGLPMVSRHLCECGGLPLFRSSSSFSVFFFFLLFLFLLLFGFFSFIFFVAFVFSSAVFSNC